MKKVLRILKNRKPLLKQREVKNQIKTMKSLFNKYNIKMDIRNELDYYNASMTYQGILNKESYEKVYEDNRQDLFDLWDTIDRNRKNFFANKALDNYRNTMPSFICDESVCRMPMLEKLFNDLYEKEIAILELPQYFKFKMVFSNHLVNPFDEYYDLPYKYGFINVDYIYSDDECLAIYEKINSNIYYIYKNKEVKSLQLKSDLDCFNDVEFIKAYIENDENRLIRIIIENDYVDQKIKEKIIKLERKKNDK